MMLAIVLGLFVDASASPAPSLWGSFDLFLVSDSIWGHCDMTITVAASGVGELTNVCRVYDGPLRRKTRRLTGREVGELRALLRQADVFGKVSEGTDQRGIDLPLITLKVVADGRTTEVV